MHKRGFLRIVEAVIAITIIISVMFIYFNKSREVKETDLSERARAILEEIGKNSTLRNAVIFNQTAPIANFAQSKLPETHLLFELKVCDINSVCGKSNYTAGNVYSAERTVSSTLNAYDPKKVRLFIWEK